MKTIQELRQEHSWSLTELASHVRTIDRSTLDQLERGQEPPTIAQLQALAEVFGVPREGIKLDSRYRLVDVRGHCFTLTARWQEYPRTREAVVHLYDRSQAHSLPAGTIPGTEPPTNEPSLILTAKWTETGLTDDEAFDALERRIREALGQAFAAGVPALPGH